MARKQVASDGGSELAKLAADIEKRLGEGIMVSASKVPRFVHIPTGVFLLDYSMVGGYAEGCGHMIYGTEGSSKTTLCLLVVAAMQRKYKDGIAAFVVVEKKIDQE